MTQPLYEPLDLKTLACHAVVDNLELMFPEKINALPQEILDFLFLEVVAPETLRPLHLSNPIEISLEVAYWDTDNEISLDEHNSIKVFNDLYDNYILLKIIEKNDQSIQQVPLTTEKIFGRYPNSAIIAVASHPHDKRIFGATFSNGTIGVFTTDAQSLSPERYEWHGYDMQVCAFDESGTYLIGYSTDNITIWNWTLNKIMEIHQPIVRLECNEFPKSYPSVAWSFASAKITHYGSLPIRYLNNDIQPFDRLVFMFIKHMCIDEHSQKRKLNIAELEACKLLLEQCHLELEIKNYLSDFSGLTQPKPLLYSDPTDEKNRFKSFLGFDKVSLWISNLVKRFKF